MPSTKTAKKQYIGKLTSQKLMAMSEAQRDAIVAPYENGVDESEFRPLTAAERRRFETWRKNAKANRRKAGRPVVGAGSKLIAVSIERDLLKEADRYAKAHAMKRAQLIAHGLRLAMAS